MKLIYFSKKNKIKYLKIDKDHNIIAGDNVVWTGAQWEIFPGKDGVEVKDTNINDIFQ